MKKKVKRICKTLAETLYQAIVLYGVFIATIAYFKANEAPIEQQKYILISVVSMLILSYILGIIGSEKK